MVLAVDWGIGFVCTLGDVMKKSDLYREYARVIDMCEADEISTYGCVKHNGIPLSGVPYFNNEPAKWEFALAIVEGKPVFEGDVLYDSKGNKYNIPSGAEWYWNNYSWTQPKPATITVTIPYAVAKSFLEVDKISEMMPIMEMLNNAIKEALK